MKGDVDFMKKINVLFENLDPLEGLQAIFRVHGPWVVRSFRGKGERLFADLSDAQKYAESLNGGGGGGNGMPGNHLYVDDEGNQTCELVPFRLPNQITRKKGFPI